VIARPIPTGTHGRYLVLPPLEAPAFVVVGFHGYAETAETQFERLQMIPGSSHWLLVSIQGLHRFYRRRSDEVVASWMTRQDRDLAIADNLTYVSRVLDDVSREWPSAARMALVGFSQGVAMAYRAAVTASQPARGVIAVGGDIPPELDRWALGRIGAALAVRGRKDEWYTAEKQAADLKRLGAAGVPTESLTFDGGHEWNAEVARASGEFLRLNHLHGPQQQLRASG
jgi:predicted esterase